MKLLLASQSPRRRELLAHAGVSFETFAPDIDEVPKRGESPVAMVKRLARAKALAAIDRARATGCAVVIASDTTVARGAKVMNKPRDDRDAARMLRALSGVRHAVHTAVSVLDVARGRARTFVVSTRVTFRRLSSEDVRRYVASGEGRDKAGAYAIQGIGAGLIERIEGSYTNVIGLPLAETLAAIQGHT